MIVTSTSVLRSRRASRRAHSKPVNPLPTITTDVTMSMLPPVGNHKPTSGAATAAKQFSRWKIRVTHQNAGDANVTEGETHGRRRERSHRPSPDDATPRRRDDEEHSEGPGFGFRRGGRGGICDLPGQFRRPASQRWTWRRDRRLACRRCCAGLVDHGGAASPPGATGPEQDSPRRRVATLATPDRPSCRPTYGRPT